MARTLPGRVLDVLRRCSAGRHRVDSHARRAPRFLARSFPAFPRAFPEPLPEPFPEPLPEPSRSLSAGAYGFLARVFAAFDRWRISIDVIASSEVSVSLTLNKNQLLERRSISALEQSPGAERSEERGLSELSRSSLGAFLQASSGPRRSSG